MEAEPANRRTQSLLLTYHGCRKPLAQFQPSISSLEETFVLTPNLNTDSKDCPEKAEPRNVRVARVHDASRVSRSVVMKGFNLALDTLRKYHILGVFWGRVSRNHAVTCDKGRSGHAR